MQILYPDLLEVAYSPGMRIPQETDKGWTLLWSVLLLPVWTGTMVQATPTWAVVQPDLLLSSRQLPGQTLDCLQARKEA